MLVASCRLLTGAAAQIVYPPMLDIAPELDRAAVCFEPVPSLDRPPVIGWPDRIH